MLTFSRQNLRKNIWLQFITNPLFEGKEETNFLAVNLSILSIDVEKKNFSPELNRISAIHVSLHRFLEKLNLNLFSMKALSTNSVAILFRLK